MEQRKALTIVLLMIEQRRKGKSPRSAELDIAKRVLERLQEELGDTK